MKIMKHLILIATLTGAANAQAATICVNKAGSGGCQTTIQAAVDLAAAGDTIKIAKGTYLGAVAVVTNDLTLQGASATATIIDSVSATGITITANNVKVIGLGIHSANTGINVNGTGFSLSKSQIQNISNNCVSGSANGAVISGNRFFGCGLRGITFGTADNAKITSNKIIGPDNGGMSLTGANLLVEKNVVERSEDDDCFTLTGANAKVNGNTCTSADGESFEITGANPVVTGNKSYASKDIEINCNGNCATAVVSKNYVYSSLDDNNCYTLDFLAAGGTVSSNVAMECFANAFNITGSQGASYSKNNAVGCGAEGEDGFVIGSDTASTLTGNKASLCGTGFVVNNALAHVLNGNTATGNFIDGFSFEGNSTGVQVTGNTATGNIEEGFDNRGTSNVFSKNKASKNREGSDFCNGGTTTVVEDDNKFATTTTSCIAVN